VIEETDVKTPAAHAPSPPWYREPWPWVLIALPGTVIVGCAITLWLALKSDDGVVTSDYYKRGLAINTELTRSRRATQFGLRAEVEMTGMGRGDQIRVRITAERLPPTEPTLRLSLFHPGRDGADRVAVLTRVAGDANGAEYAGEWGEVVPVHPVAWQVAIESPTWRLDGHVSAAEERVFRLDAVR
jgi:hypothetical protein